MSRLEPEDLVDLESYTSLREDYRRAVIAHKRERRMAVGDRVTLLFEDRETLRFQVLEMLFVERIADPAKVQDELDVYNELMPADRELSATLFLEITEPGRIRPELDRLIGIDEHVALEIGEGSPLVRAHFDPKQMEEDRLSAVQYIRFALDEEQAERFAEAGTPAWIRIDHPNYVCRAEIPPPVRASLIAGLRAAPPPLLDPEHTDETARPSTLFETENVRAWTPGGASLRAIVETRRPDHELLAEESPLWTELGEALRRAARHVAGDGGRCRIDAGIDAGHGAARFLVVAYGERSDS